jgi:hypothetical protein
MKCLFLVESINPAARGIVAEPPATVPTSARSARRGSMARVMERIARREQAKPAKRLAQIKLIEFIKLLMKVFVRLKLAKRWLE